MGKSLKEILVDIQNEVNELQLATTPLSGNKEVPMPLSECFEHIQTKVKEIVQSSNAGSMASQDGAPPQTFRLLAIARALRHWANDLIVDGDGPAPLIELEDQRLELGSRIRASFASLMNSLSSLTISEPPGV